MWCFVLFTKFEITTVCEKVAHFIGFVYGPCIRVHDHVHGRVLWAVYMAVIRPIHGRIHGPLQGHVLYCSYTAHVHGLYRVMVICEMRKCERVFCKTTCETLCDWSIGRCVFRRLPVAVVWWINAYHHIIGPARHQKVESNSKPMQLGLSLVKLAESR